MDISFDTPFDCIICLNGDFNESSVFSLLAKIPIIAADGAANKLLQIGIVPNVVIGDMDSIDADLLFNSNINIIKDIDQNTNDFEKCLSNAIANNYSSCLVLGINGGQFEHSINNLSVAIKYAEKINICIYTDTRYGFYVSKSIHLHINKDEIISIIPCPVTVLSSKNLKWELNNYKLELGVCEGARNRAVAEDVFIKLHSGSYLLFIDHRLPFSFNSAL